MKQWYTRRKRVVWAKGAGSEPEGTFAIGADQINTGESGLNSNNGGTLSLILISSSNPPA